MEWEKVDDLLDAFDKNNVKIQYIRTAVTSPWIDPQGKSYTYRITLSFLSEDEVFLRFFNTKKLIPIVYIYLKEPLEERTEFNKRPLYDRRFSIKDRVRMVGSFAYKEGGIGLYEDVKRKWHLVIQNKTPLSYK